MAWRVHILGANAQAMVPALSGYGLATTVCSRPPYPEDCSEDLVVLATGPDEPLPEIRARQVAVLAGSGEAQVLSALAAGALDSSTSPGDLAARLAARLGLRRTAEVPTPGEDTDHPPRILVVEDDADIRGLLSIILAGYEVRLAADGVEGLESAQESPPDLVLTDLMLPGMDGFSLLGALAREPALSQVPVVILSARGAESDRILGLGLGAVDYLSKPFSPVELLARVERSLRMSRHRRDLAALGQTDALTGVADARALRARLDEEVRRARRYRSPLACLMLRVEGLGELADRCGPEAARQVLCAFARALTGCLRETDFVARFGADAFAVLLPETGLTEAGSARARLEAELAQRPVRLPALPQSVQPSLAVHAQGPDELDAHRLLSQAVQSLRLTHSGETTRAPPREARAAGALPAP
ncbi:MAG: response regulator [Myxococcales bacterium]